MYLFITSPAGAVAKYCDVCIYVCVSARRSVSLRGYLRRNLTRDLYQFLYMLPMAVARSSSGTVTKFKGEGAILGVSSPLTMHCTAEHLGPIHNRFNRSRCRLRWWVGLARGTMCYVGWRSPKGKGQFWGKICARQAQHPYELRVGLVHAAACTRQGQTLDCKR